MPEFSNDEVKRLEEIKHKEAENLAQILADKYGLPYTDLSIVPVSVEALTSIKEETAKEAELAVFDIHGNTAKVAILTPNNAHVEEVLDMLRKKDLEPELHITSEPSLATAWERYKEVSHINVSQTSTVELTPQRLKEFTDQIKSTSDVTRLVEQETKSDDLGSATKALEIVVAGALATNASDIHIQPQETAIRIRLRLDGVLQDITELDQKLYNLLVSRIKLASGVKLNIKNKAQDGRFTIRVGEDDIEIRTSVLPGAYGETIVLRLLNPKTVSLDIEKVGMAQGQLDIVLTAVKKPNGMILNTGPTGSGKTTTLYSLLKYVNKPGINIITIEDPVEYHIKGITQTQIKKGYTFLEGLRSALRQDPDIMMVGEIRDGETAKVAINSALTGHLVLSTLHTNTAAGAIPRLLDLEVDSKVLGDALTVAMAQRLLRRLCTECKEEYTPNEEEKTLLSEVLNEVPQEYKKEVPEVGSPVWRAKGCDACNGTGYKGREGIFEIIQVDESVEAVILNNPSEREIWNTTKNQGLLRMRGHGVLKVLSGITDLEELSRVVDLKES
ncbi:hypothetical protein CL654_00785 [bacterium]|nr:hypothetical protein [bacterium]|tara:strand:- start:399 stop:2072 length:1674 start_codon:yes stop_codon:yes gene_type:complete